MKNGSSHEDHYSLSDDEVHMEFSTEINGDGDTSIQGIHNYSTKEVFTVHVPVSRRSSLLIASTPISTTGQYDHIPGRIAAELNQNLATLGDDFSVTKMLQQMDRRPYLSQTVNTSKEDKYGDSKSQPKNDTSNDFPEMFSPSALGMSATRRKPIKGAAGRPIQFQYDELLRRAKNREQTKAKVEEEKPRRLISVPLQISIFVVVAFVVLVFLTMETTHNNPFHSQTGGDTELLQP
ncbi:LEM domain-containing protein 1 isoform X2 [Hyperolius riggenbachi]